MRLSTPNCILLKQQSWFIEYNVGLRDVAIEESKYESERFREVLTSCLDNVGLLVNVSTETVYQWRLSVETLQHKQKV